MCTSTVLVAEALPLQPASVIGLLTVVLSAIATSVPLVPVQIGVPPSGYRYVRVASDILMIAIGTGMVVDAIRDLGR
jgi:hypothetical protein